MTVQSNLGVGHVSRRTFLAAPAFVGVVAASTRTLAQMPADHNHMDHSSRTKSGPPMAHGAHAGLVSAARECERAGEVCSKHCLTLMAKGDTSLIECFKTVTALIPVASALRKLALSDAKRLKEYCRVTVDIAADCDAECHKHAGHHVQCKACEDACKAVIAECNKVIA